MPGGSSCGCCCCCGGGGRVVMAMVVVMSVVVSLALAQTGGDGGDGGGGIFQLQKSCGMSLNTRHLSAATTMWLRGAGEEVTLTASGNSTSKPCVLPPNVSHKITVQNDLEVHKGGAAGEEDGEDVCHFFKNDTIVLPKGALMVSCLAHKTQAEKEMLGAEESSSSESPSATPQDRALDPPSAEDAPIHTPATPLPVSPSSHAPPAPLAPLELPTNTTTTITTTTTGTRAEDLDTTLTATEAPASTNPPPPLHDGGMGTTLGHDTTLSEHATQKHDTTPTPREDTTPREHTTPRENTTLEQDTTDMTDNTPDSSSSSSSTQVSTPGSSTQDTGQAGKTPQVSREHPPLTRDENISVRELTAQSGGRQVPGEHDSDEHDDHFIYLAGAGAAVAVLVLCVVVVACVVHRRSRKTKKMDPSDLFMSGGYRGSLNSMSGSQGAYLNAHIMYSGAEPEFVESFEMEERILTSNVSYSTHDIPKCLKEP